MIKEIIAYILVIFGLPLLIGSVIWFVPGVLLAVTIGKKHDKLESMISAFGEGIISSVVGMLIFHWLNATPLWMVLILLSIVVIVWNGARKESFLNFPEIAGIVLGFAIMQFLL